MATDDVYLEVTYRHGKPFAAYLHFPRRTGERSYRSRRVEPGLVIDFNRKGKPLGIEITAPSVVTLRALNRVLRELGLPSLKRADLAPLLAPSRLVPQPRTEEGGQGNGNQRRQGQRG